MMCRACTDGTGLKRAKQKVRFFALLSQFADASLSGRGGGQAKAVQPSCDFRLRRFHVAAAYGQPLENCRPGAEGIAPVLIRIAHLYQIMETQSCHILAQYAQAAIAAYLTPASLQTAHVRPVDHLFDFLRRVFHEKTLQSLHNLLLFIRQPDREMHRIQVM